MASAVTQGGLLRAGSNLMGWMFTILRNTWFNQLRRKRTAREVVPWSWIKPLAASDTVRPDDPYTLLTAKVEKEQCSKKNAPVSIACREMACS